MFCRKCNKDKFQSVKQIIDNREVYCIICKNCGSFLKYLNKEDMLEFMDAQNYQPVIRCNKLPKIKEQDHFFMGGISLVCKDDKKRKPKRKKKNYNPTFSKKMTTKQLQKLKEKVKKLSITAKR